MKADSVAVLLALLRRVDIDSPAAEFVREPADVGAPRLLRQRYLDPPAFRKCVEDLGEAGLSVPLSTIAMLLPTLAG